MIQRAISFLFFFFFILINIASVFSFENNSGFIENKGQIIDQNGNPRADIFFSTNDLQVFITGTSLHYQFNKIVESDQLQKPEVHNINSISKRIPSTIYRVDIQLVGSNPNTEIVKEYESNDYENFYNVISNPEGILNVRSYSKVTFKNVYNGIDWVLYKKAEGIKYEFIVQPNVNPNVIKLKISGADNITISPNGELLLKTDAFAIKEFEPVSFQNNQNIKTKFVKDNNYISFQIENYNRNDILIIDPWATYYGGNNWDDGELIATDNSGNCYLGGTTASANNIATIGAHQVSYLGNYDFFLVKFNSSGVRQWASYYGGSNQEAALALTTYGSEFIYFGGYTNSTSNITTPGSYQINFAGINDAFLIKFNSNGIRVWGTYYGGPSGDATDGLATDDLGNIYLGGSTTSPANISTPGAHQMNIGGSSHDAFLVKFNPEGVRQWATYYGGSEIDIGEDLTIDNSNNIYLGGHTSSTANISTSGSHQENIGGGTDAYIAKFNSDGIRQWATYYGGMYNDGGNLVGIKNDNIGNIYLTGNTQSPDNISTAGAHQVNWAGGSDAFLVKFNANGFRQWGTYYGGTELDNSNDVSIDNSQNVYIIGETSSTANISTPGTNQENLNSGGADAYIVKFNSLGIRQWGTYFGGTSWETGYGIACDNNNNVFASGITYSLNIATSNAHQTQYGGDVDAFLASFRNTNGTLSINILSSNIPSNFDLYQNYPNPFNPTTKIKFDINKTGFVKLKIYDITGREIASLVNTQLTAGQYEYKWDASNFASGIYFYILKLDDASFSRRMILIK